MDYKTKLIAALAEYVKEVEASSLDELFASEYNSHEYMSDIDNLSMGLNDLGFAIDYTTQGQSGEPFLDVSYWSRAIQKQISFGEIGINFKTAAAFIEWASQTKQEIDTLEAKLATLKI